MASTNGGGAVLARGAVLVHLARRAALGHRSALARERFTRLVLDDVVGEYETHFGIEEDEDEEEGELSRR